MWCRVLRRRVATGRPPERHAAPRFGKDVHFVNALRRDQIVRGVPVARIDEDGHGVVELYVRHDKQEFEFTFERAIPGEKLHLRVQSAIRDRYNKKKPGRYRLLVEQRGAASVNEVTPTCAHFEEKCGGCSFQHLDYDAQLREKHSLLSFRLNQYGLADVEPGFPLKSPETYSFHSRTEFKFFLRNGLHLGLHPVKNPVPVTVNRCHLHPRGSQAAFDATLFAARKEPGVQVFDQRTGRGWLCSAVFRAAMRPHAGESDILVTLVTIPVVTEYQLDALHRFANAIKEECPDVVGVMWSASGGEPQERVAGWRSTASDSQQLLVGRSSLEHTVCNTSIKTVPEAFLRPNLLVIDEICEAVLRLSGVQPQDVVWDAFCGQGLLSVLLAKQCRHLVGLERSSPALAACEQNLATNGVGSNAELVSIDLGSPAALRLLAARLPQDWFVSANRDVVDEDLPADLEDSDPDDHLGFPNSQPPLNLSMQTGSSGQPSGDTLPLPDVLVVDPGRNGLPKAFRRMMYNLGARTIVLIGSGRPLLRDTVLLSRRGYEVGKMESFDSYPHTARLETIVQLQLRGLQAGNTQLR